MGTEYKRLHEQFVSHLEGTSLAEVSAVIAVFPLGLMAAFLWWQVLERKMGLGEFIWMRFVVEFVMIILPLLTAMTEYMKDGLFRMLVLLTFLSCAAATIEMLQSERLVNLQLQMKAPAPLLAKPGHVTSFRADLLLMTCVAILAVDFHVFPRRFAKTETFGTGLMDIGVGGFVVSNAIVLGLRHERGLSFSIAKGITTSVPMVILGIVRVLMVKGVDYQEHVSEYGVHWNFFFTLAAVNIGSNVLFGHVLPESLRCHPGFVGGVIVLAHQFLLNHGLQQWVLESPRTSMISQNKEGIASILGYLSLFSLGIWLGRIQRKPLCEHVFLLAFFYSGVLLLESFGEDCRVSRRLANLPYILWTMACSQQLLVNLMVFERFLPWPFRIYSPSVIVEAVNRNQLVIFLLANVLTGLCNVLMKTMMATNEEGFSILVAYMFIVTFAGVAFEIFDVHFRMSAKFLSTPRTKQVD